MGSILQEYTWSSSTLHDSQVLTSLHQHCNFMCGQFHMVQVSLI